MRLRLDRNAGAFARAIMAKTLPVARATTAAMDAAAEALKREARAEIGRAGFSRRWQNALRVKRFPRRKISIDAAAFAWHRIPYAGVFETGASIAGRPMLWLPLPSAPRSLQRRRMSPERFETKVAPLFSMTSRRGRPLLAAQARVSKRQAQSDRPKASLAALRRGNSGRGILRSIPIYHGVSVVHLRRRFDVTGVARSVRDRVPDFYWANFRDE